MVFSCVAAASTWLAGIRHSLEDSGVGNTEHHREGAKGGATAVSSKGLSGCKASGGTGYFQPPGLGTYRQNIICNLPQLRRQKNVSAPLIGHWGSCSWPFVHLSNIHYVYPWNI